MEVKSAGFPRRLDGGRAREERAVKNDPKGFDLSNLKDEITVYRDGEDSGVNSFYLGREIGSSILKNYAGNDF